MKHYTIKRWQALALFSKMIAKYESKSEEEILEKSILAKKLRKYGVYEESNKFAASQLKYIAENESQPYPAVLKDLSRTIRKGITLIITDKRLLTLLTYIGVGSAGLSHYEEIQTNNYTNKLSLFEGSTWFLYFNDPYIDNGEEKIAVCKVVMRLMEYSYMTISSVSTNNAEHVGELAYEGEYYIKSDQNLFVEGRGNSERELRIVFSIGFNNNPFNVGDVIIGYFLDASQNINFGLVIIEKAKDDVAIDYKIYKSIDQSINGEHLHGAIWDALTRDHNLVLPEQSSLQKDDLYKLFGLIQSPLSTVI